ncbi:alpha/beta fold hydrolase [Mycolicibacterium parafortuitum]|uniref:AB hydrolase-1 domain-containing protein n=1 Tax=Mycolicibacterium parafortuitum TaxID=39692 RepID=A0A375YMG6_MYCPF|nr:alpha/beta hydrolase [Mycolicibacterium parafortuitum]ORB27078.1 hypothetical protein BST38_24930 [Mycolicibacterium parafortuitum]SRX82253.1 hypothetical protein LRC338 [Methanocella arvoryzae MRE50] [Mycolicibacterium parafortuitum]
MDLFVRDTGPLQAPAVVFLHGGRVSGWSWEPVIARLPGYRCVAPDLPQFGKSVALGPFRIDRAAEAVATSIRSRFGTAGVHLVGYSLGAQVGIDLLAREPALFASAVLCGTFVNTLPLVQPSARFVGALARTAWSRRLVSYLWNARPLEVAANRTADYREDMRLALSEDAAQIVSASAGFTVPDGLETSEVPALFITGAGEPWPAHRSAGELARRMPRGVNAVAAGMRHDWPLRYPELFSRTLRCWLTNADLPSQIAVR